MADDMGWGDLSCHGNPVIETPAIDQMARRGVELTRFYVSPVCSPTRASLMTGRYNYRTGVVDTFRGGSMMLSGETTVAELLAEAGYRTGLFGKWHLGDCYPLRAQDQGFQETVVFRGGGLAQPSEPPENERRYTDPILYRNGEPFRARGYCTDVYFDEALRFIEQSLAEDKDFFACLMTNTPHSPYHDVPEDLYRKYASRDMSQVLVGDAQDADTVARVYAMVENIDQNVGRLWDFLDSAGVADNTIVIFMSDNGPNTRRFVGERRGMKAEVHEGGILSPFFVAWPERYPRGVQRAGLAAHIDLLPTLLAAAEVAPPAGLQLDGVDLNRLLTDGDDAWPNRQLFLQAHRARPVERRHFAVVERDWKLVRPGGFSRTPAPSVTAELYRLLADPMESRNLLTRQTKEHQRLEEAYRKWFRSMQDPNGRFAGPPRIIVGNPAETSTALTWQDWQAVGEGWGEQGQWLLTVEDVGPYRATVLLEEPASGAATLTCGKLVTTQRITTVTRRIEFSSLRLPLGEAGLSFELKSGAAGVPPYQIILEHL